VSDPTRLADEGGDAATALERELLRAGKQQRLGARDKDEIWMALAAQLPLAPIAPGVPAGAGAKATAAAKAVAGGKTLGAAAALKGTLVAVALGGASLVGYRALHAPAPVVNVAAPAARAVPPEAPAPPSAPAAEPASRPRSRRTSLPEARGLADATPRPPQSHLAAEGRIVLEARKALRDGHPEDALRVLEAAREEFADGALVQEREALTIEALARSGRRADASHRATSFLRAHPESPHAAAVKAFAAP
jgi:hypothetical protein